MKKSKSRSPRRSPRSTSPDRSRPPVRPRNSGKDHITDKKGYIWWPDGKGTWWQVSSGGRELWQDGPYYIWSRDRGATRWTRWPFRAPLYSISRKYTQPRAANPRQSRSRSPDRRQSRPRRSLKKVRFRDDNDCPSTKRPITRNTRRRNYCKNVGQDYVYYRTNQGYGCCKKKTTAGQGAGRGAGRGRGRIKADKVVQCSGKSQDGKRCKRKVKGTRYCYQHKK